MELSTRYQPADLEQALYARWEQAGVFQPPPPGEGKEPFTVMIPPPNVTGVLHMGHALNGTVQDIVVRHRRLSGRACLWLPGTDHAGIATQAVVEKKLYEERKLTREQIGREAFQAEIWKWVDEHGSYILRQFRRLGASCDWTRTRFTLEAHMSRAVREAFVRLWEKGLVYRGARLVNWDCVLQTAVSDDEVEYAPQKGKLYHLRYPLEGRPGEHVVVATTRPETMLGDSGVAVHPEDERYRALIGARVVLPFLERAIPIVADDTVEAGFGTGAVKVTPGHDPADYERGKRHGLAVLSILEKDGRINAAGGPFAGLSREEARKRIVAELDALGLLEKVEDIRHNVALSDRSKSPIEPLISEQWFVRMEPLARPAIAAVRDGSLRIRPERHTREYLRWLENVQDWCISRQLWWGHQIPVWYDEDGAPVASREDLAVGSPHPRTGKPIVRQDEDVLDTWASSWLWPFATLGWPDATEDLARFYPTQFLSTAREILYLWVARMVMAGYEFLDQLPPERRCPFADCYINATVLDAKGRRMSKSAGNGIDPLEMIEKYGADAVRYSLMLLTKEGQDVKLAPDKFEQGYRFGNKVWNAARFVIGHLRAGEDLALPARAQLELEDRWILSRLRRVARECGEALESYRFHDAALGLYRFVWNDLCDWYLEIAKPRLARDDQGAASARAVLARVLADALVLLHPFTPFLTEELWGHLHRALGREAGLLAAGKDAGGGALWPSGAGLALDEEAERELALVQEVVAAVRRVRNLTQVGERDPLVALASAPRAEEREQLARRAELVCSLAHLSELQVGERAERPPASAVAVAGAVELFVVLGAEVDLARLKDALEKRALKVAAGMAQTDAKLANASFVERAEPEVVEEERARRAELALELELLERNVTGL